MRDRHDPALEALVRIERKLDLVMQHFGLHDYPPPAPAYLDEVRDLIRQRKKIQAIKVYREHTDAGLKEAKDAVDRLEAGH